jgi:hypothetical protein
MKNSNDTIAKRFRNLLAYREVAIYVGFVMCGFVCVCMDFGMCVCMCGFCNVCVCVCVCVCLGFVMCG